MRVDITIYDQDKNVVYGNSREMDYIPNIGEGILLDLNEPGGWLDDKYYCEYAVCTEKYQVFNNTGTAYFVCDFIGEGWHRD